MEVRRHVLKKLSPALYYRAHHLRVLAVTITGGDRVSQDGSNWRVPKRDLVGAVQVPLEQGKLKIAPALSSARLLEQELVNFKVKMTPKPPRTLTSPGAKGSMMIWC